MSQETATSLPDDVGIRDRFFNYDRTRIPTETSFRGNWPLEYPDADGKLRSDHTKQGGWMTKISNNIEAMYYDRSNVFIASALIWYAREGEPDERDARM